MKILFLSPTGQPGGAEVALVDLLAGLRTAQPAWSLSLIAASDGPLLTRARALGVEASVVPFPGEVARLGEWSLGRARGSRLAFLLHLGGAAWPAWAYVRRLRARVRALAPDIVHTNGMKMHLLGAWVCPPRTALLWHLHDYVGPRRISARLLRACAGRCSAIVTNSRSVADDARRVGGKRLPVHPIWNAIDLDRFSPRGAVADLDALAGMPPATPGIVRVGLVATFARWKGHRIFLDALARLPGSVPWRGYVVGGPLYDTSGSQVTLEELRAHAAALGIGDRVGFTGFTDAAAAMRALDVVVHASTEPEPFGLVIAEAMASGRPVVVADAGGATELIAPGADALACPPGDPHLLASRIAALASDPALRRRLGEAGRLTAERAFARQRMAGAFAALYEQLRTQTHAAGQPG